MTSCDGRSPRDPQAGFTLIETLVALAVLAVGAMAVLAGAERYAANTRGLEDRIVARWVAENALSATTLNLPLEQRWIEAAGIVWRIELETQRLPNSGLSMVTARVSDAAAGQGASLVALTGYLALEGEAK
ncbi:MAG: type II secretion system minor pseudopilin GspI [Pelagibaca sp.]